MAGANKMMLIFIGETTMHGEIPLYEAIVRRLAALEVKGATVQTGVMGFGSHHKVHRKRLFGVTDDRPVTITVVDSEEKLRQAAPEIRPLVRDGLMILIDVEEVTQL
jgi:uncharacterized protein